MIASQLAVAGQLHEPAQRREVDAGQRLVARVRGSNNRSQRERLAAFH